MRAVNVVAFLLVSVALAGCVEQRRQSVDCPDADGCEPLPGEAPRNNLFPPPRGNLTLPDALYPSFQMAACDEYVAATEVPRNDLQKVVPDAFAVRGLSQQTGSLLIKVRDCDRSLNNTTVFGPATLYLTYARVVPINESWADEGSVNFYLLDAATENGALGEMLRNFSFDAVEVEPALTRQDAPGGHFVASWSFVTDAWEASLAFPLVDEGTRNTLTREIHYWYGSGPSHRLTDHSSAVVYGSIMGGTFSISGDARAASVLPSPVVPVLIEYHVNVEAFVQYDGAWT